MVSFKRCSSTTNFIAIVRIALTVWVNFDKFIASVYFDTDDASCATAFRKPVDSGLIFTRASKLWLFH